MGPRRVAAHRAQRCGGERQTGRRGQRQRWQAAAGSSRQQPPSHGRAPAHSPADLEQQPPVPAARAGSTHALPCPAHGAGSPERASQARMSRLTASTSGLSTSPGRLRCSAAWMPAATSRVRLAPGRPMAWPNCSRRGQSAAGRRACCEPWRASGPGAGCAAAQRRSSAHRGVRSSPLPLPRPPSVRACTAKSAKRSASSSHTATLPLVWYATCTCSQAGGGGQGRRRVPRGCARCCGIGAGSSVARG